MIYFSLDALLSGKSWSSAGILFCSSTFYSCWKKREFTHQCFKDAQFFYKAIVNWVVLIKCSINLLYSLLVRRQISRFHAVSESHVLG